MNRIEHKFYQLKKLKKKAFIAFITAGYPDLKTTERLVIELAKISVDIIELGVPFSDPLADGPTIQEASEEALKKKTNLNKIFSVVKMIRKASDIPICLMSYYNPIFCFGQENFVRKAKQVGVDGVIVPDLPPEEGRYFIRLAKRFNLDVIFFLSPTSHLKRIRLISQVSKGFIYYVSLTGTTGTRRNLPTDLVENLKLIKKHTQKPVCVGFGVSSCRQIKQIYRVADGVIVGSAIIKEIKRHLKNKNLAKLVANYVLRLKNVQ